MNKVPLLENFSGSIEELDVPFDGTTSPADDAIPVIEDRDTIPVSSVTLKIDGESLSLKDYLATITDDLTIGDLISVLELSVGNTIQIGRSDIERI